ncbi:MAG: tyrosine-type recombinase/integrase [Deltaproteobacteria bacterium]|nr:tyrosine-type recombinase/integrase [Deltaproteobacteria bacterium]
MGAKRARRLPVVLTHEEVRSILGQLQGLDWIMAMLLYGAGLRLMECLRLRVKDIDLSTNHDLHPRFESRRPRGFKPCGSALIELGGCIACGLIAA